VPSVPMHAQQSKSAVTLEALAAKVKRLEDVQEITDVLIAYGRCGLEQSLNVIICCRAKRHHFIARQFFAAQTVLQNVLHH